MRLGVRAGNVAVVAAAALAWGGAWARAGETVLWHNAPPVSMSGMISVVRSGPTGVESGSVRCADDFTLADPD